MMAMMMVMMMMIEDDDNDDGDEDCDYDDYNDDDNEWVVIIQWCYDALRQKNFSIPCKLAYCWAQCYARLLVVTEGGFWS